LGILVHELQTSNDRNWQIARTKYESLYSQWEKLSNIIIRRHTLAQSYVNFRYQAEQVTVNQTLILFYANLF
jgi:hypothetical protein